MSSAVSFEKEQSSRDQSPIDPSQIHVEAINSPLRVDSNVDVTSYANEMVQQVEGTQLGNLSSEFMGSTVTRPEIGFSPDSPATGSSSVPLRTSTPTPFDGEIEASASLSQLESALNVANATETGLPELLPVSNTGQEVSDAPQLQPEDDNVSSVC